MPKQKIEIEIRGGIAEIVGKVPEGVTVFIRDYDIENYDEDRLEKDSKGNECFMREFESK